MFFRRIHKIDQARASLFVLEHEETPVEGLAVNFIGIWPVSNGEVVPASQAAGITTVMSDRVTAMPVIAVLLLTSSYLRWIPYRSYRGRPVYPGAIDRLLAGGAEVEKGTYGRFSHALLGEQALPLSSVRLVSIDLFDRADLMVANVYFTEATIKGEGGWPLYELSSFGEAVPIPAMGWAEPDDATPYVQFHAYGSATWAAAAGLAPAFAHLGVSITAHSLDDSSRAVWNEAIEQRNRPWRPLSERLRESRHR